LGGVRLDLNWDQQFTDSLDIILRVDSPSVDISLRLWDPAAKLCTAQPGFGYSEFSGHLVHSH
jgi:hypothetical protein